ncbi:cation acetate symporter [Ammoniphilus sp. YIM 78166]|uniref:solute symporter family protein n=1 Tax=Ammoniphilus sp. YIM 78166 TaxID=1644106 RepID=UPI00106F4AEB|nr:cation acetate symporter [Ammoniphilus sp. YIM 78166]
MNISGVIFFLAILVGTLAITYSAVKRTTNTNEYYVAGNRLTGTQNGLAIAGDYMSAASFLGISGTIALYGFDGFLYSVGFLVSYLVLLLIVAEPLHNLGKFTLADTIAVRFDHRWLRGTVAFNTIVISIFYMIAQLVGAGAVIHLLLNLDVSFSIFIAGLLMVIYVVFGGMIATSWVQIIKTILLLSTTVIISMIVLSRFHWNVFEMFTHVTTATHLGERFLLPGNELTSPIETFSFHLALVLGAAGLPHIITRLFTVKDAISIRRSVVTATGVVGIFYLMTIFLGFGAAAFVRSEKIEGGNLAVPLLANALGGEFLMAFVSAVAFTTILAVVTGLALSASSAFAHDFYSTLIRKGQASDEEQMVVAKGSAAAVGLVSIFLALTVQKWNVAFLVSLAFAVAASANLPLILLTLFWRQFNPIGAISGIMTGLLSSIILVILSPNVMDPVSGLIRMEALFPLKNPGVVTIPLGFLGAYLGTILSRKWQHKDKYDELLFRAHTGAVLEEK